MTRRLLVVDDDPEVIEIVTLAFEGREVEVHGAYSGETALDRIERRLPDVILLDVRLPNMNGLEIFRLLKDRGIDVPVILTSSYTSMDLAIQAMQEGAFDYLDKPLRPRRLVALIESMFESQESRGDADEPVPTVSSAEREPWELVGRSDRMLEVYKTIGRVTSTNSTVLITGESGTGKGLVARTIHEKGPRAGQPFEVVSCSTIPSPLLEEELFGYEKGAVSGAERGRPGRFELAGHGSIFLAEVGEVPVSLQPKLLAALEERGISRIGGSRTIPLEARVLAATNQDLDAAVATGLFRGDLLRRLAVVDIRVPPLRERIGDIPILTSHILSVLGPQLGRRVEAVAPETYRRLEEYSWPGNVRELRNVLERSLMLGTGPTLRPRDLPALEEEEGSRPLEDLRELAREGIGLDELERRYIQVVLDEQGGNRTQAARTLGIHRSTLHRKLRRVHAAET